MSIQKTVQNQKKSKYSPKTAVDEQKKRPAENAGAFLPLIFLFRADCINAGLFHIISSDRINESKQ